jgi:hypothetical protein
MLLGCATSQKHQSLEQVIAKTQYQQKNNRLQEALLTQADRAVLTGYQDYKVSPEDLLTIRFLENEDLGEIGRAHV